MNFINPVKISLRNLSGAKMRSFLTILGIIIGIASVIIIMAIGLSAQALIVDQVKGVGSNLIGVLPGASDEEGPPPSAMGISITTFTYDDLQALRNSRNVPEAEDGAGYVLGSAVLEYQNYSNSHSFIGTTASYINVENAEIAEGRFFDEEEEENLARLAVLGSTAAKDIFGGEDPLNKKIKIKDQNFLVIGVFASRGSIAFGAGGQDDSVVVPLKTAQKILMGINHLGFARLKIKSPELIPFAIANAKATLRDRHNITDPDNDDFSVRDQAAALESITQITNIIRYFILAIGALSLVVGGVGIMNTMLIAVSERIHEVGLRKAIGAKNSDILFQFLIESATITLLGGIIGIVLGAAVSFLASIIIQSLGYNWPFLISGMSLAVATSISVAIGIVFGMYPARQASRVSPMEALRYE